MTREEAKKRMRELETPQQAEERVVSGQLNIEEPESPVENLSRLSREQAKYAMSLIGGNGESTYSIGRSLADKEGAFIDSIQNRDTLAGYYNAYTDSLNRAIENKNEEQYYKNRILLNKIDQKLGRTSSPVTWLGDAGREIATGITSFTSDLEEKIAQAGIGTESIGAEDLYRIAKQDPGTLAKATKGSYGFESNSWKELQRLKDQYPDDNVIQNVYNTVSKQGYKGDLQYFKDTVPYINNLNNREKYDTFKANNNVVPGVKLTNQQFEQAQQRLETEESLSYNGLGKFILDGIGVASQMLVPALIGTAVGEMAGGLGAAEKTATSLRKASVIGGMSASAAGNVTNQTLAEGYDWGKSTKFGDIMGIVEGLTEQIGGEFVNSVLFGGKVSTPVGQVLSSFIKKHNITSPALKLGLVILTDINAEGLEEVASDFVEPFVRQAVLGDDEAFKDWGKNMGQAYVSSIVPTLIMGGFGIAQTRKSVEQGSNYLEARIRANTQLTNEQKAQMIEGLRNAAEDAKVGLFENYDEMRNDINKQLAEKSLKDAKAREIYDLVNSTGEALTDTQKQRTAQELLKRNGLIWNPGTETSQELLDENTKVETAYNNVGINKDIAKLMADKPNVTDVKVAENINKIQQNISNLVKKLLDYEVIWTNIRTNDGTSIKGFTSTDGDKVVYVNASLNTKDGLAATFHELGHHIAKTNTELFNEYKQELQNKYGANLDTILQEANQETGTFNTTELSEAQKNYLIEELFGDEIGETMSKQRNISKAEESTRTLFDSLRNMANKASYVATGKKAGNEKVSAYNLYVSSYLDRGLINKRSFEDKILNIFQGKNKGKTAVQELTKKTKEITKQETKAKTNASKKEEPSKSEVNRRIEDKYAKMREDGARTPEILKMIAKELGLKYDPFIPVSQRGADTARLNDILSDLREDGKITETGTKLSARKELKSDIARKFEELTGDSIMRAGTRLAGIELRNRARENGNFYIGYTNEEIYGGREMEQNPYSKEAMELYNRYHSGQKTSSHLYHATGIDRLKSIIKNGLTTGNRQTHPEISSPNEIYLAASPELAEMYAPVNFVTLRIHPKFYDKFENFREDLFGGQGSYAITNNIPPEMLQIKENGKWVNLLASKQAKELKEKSMRLSAKKYKGRILKKGVSQLNGMQYEDSKTGYEQVAQQQNAQVLSDNPNLATYIFTEPEKEKYLRYTTNENFYKSFTVEQMDQIIKDGSKEAAITSSKGKRYGLFNSEGNIFAFEVFADKNIPKDVEMKVDEIDFRLIEDFEEDNEDARRNMRQIIRDYNRREMDRKRVGNSFKSKTEAKRDDGLSKQRKTDRGNDNTQSGKDDGQKQSARVATPEDSRFNYSKRKKYTNDELLKLNFKENTRPNDDFAQAQYRYIKGKVRDLIDTINTEEGYDIVATPSTRYNDSLTVKLKRNGNTIKSFRIQNKDWWNAKEKGIVKKIKLSDYKQVGGLLSAVKSTIAKEFDAGVKLTKEEQQKRALKGKDKIIKGIKETGRETIKGYIKENERLLKVGRNEELRLKEKAERESKKAEGKISRLSRAYLQKKFGEEFERKAHTANIHYGREYKNLYTGLRETKMDQKEAFALANAIYNESQRVNKAIKSSLNILNELRKRKIYNKLPSELKEKIDSYNEFWSKSGKMADLTLAKRILNDATIRELIGKVALTNSVRNQLLDNNKESVSLKDYLTSIEMAEQFEAGLEQLRNEVKEFQAKDFEEERVTELQENIDLIKDDIEYELGKRDNVPLRNLVKKFGNRTMLNSLMTFKTETQALMGGNINTPLMMLENNLQKGEARKKRAITNVYGLLNDFLTSSSGINKVLGVEKWKKTLEKSLSNSSDWVDTNITATTKRGREVELRLPKSMIMSLAMHLMNDQNMAHISGAVTRVVTDNNGNTIPTFREGEGIRIPNENLYKLGKSREAYDRGITVKLSYSQVQELVSTLTEEEQQFVEAVKRVFDYTTKLINEVSNNIMGYDLATVENYFPLHTWINQSKQTTDNGRLLNKHSIVDAYTYLTSAGWLQDRVTSFAPIYLENIAEVLDRTVNNVANYYGYAEALRDNNLILRSEFEEPIEFGDGLEEGTLREAIGQLSSSYLENYERLTRFIVGAETQRDSKLRSLMAMNTLTFNMGTWLTQPMSFFNTIKYYSGKDFLSGINPINNNLRLNRLIRQYYEDLGIDTSDTNDYQLARAFISMATPNLDYRAIGYKTPDIRQLYNKNIEDKIGAHGIEAFDNIAVTAVARMMAWTLSQDSNLEFGSEEYFERLGAELTQVLVETQPEFSHINRANIFRSHNGIARMLSLFGTPANQMFNNFAQSWLEFRYQVREGNKKAIGKAFNNLSKSISGVLVSSMAVGLIRALRDQIRADDDETELQDRWISHSIIAMLGPTLVLDDVAQFVMAEAKYGGINSYDFNSPETTLLNGITNFAKKTEQLFKDEVSPTKKTIDLIKAVGTITPIDTKGLIRDITTLMRVISPDTYKAYQLQNDSTVYKKWKENSDTDMAQFYKAYTNTRNSVLESKYGYHKADKEKGIESNLKESRRKALKDVLGNDADVNKYMKILFDYKD